jgi:pre-mRNA cleavage complex 2 protein Pcf11
MAYNYQNPYPPPLQQPRYPTPPQPQQQQYHQQPIYAHPPPPIPQPHHHSQSQTQTQIPYDPFRQDYAERLRQLTFNSRPLIQDLSMRAMAQRDQHNWSTMKAVVEEIEAAVLRVCCE